MFLMTLTMCMIIMMISMLTMTAASIKKNSHSKKSPFECGFDPKNSSRLPFSIQFLLISVIFLISDLEMALLMPMILILYYSNMFMYLLTTSFFILILMIGLFHEWNQGALNWSY